MNRPKVLPTRWMSPRAFVERCEARGWHTAGQAARALGVDAGDVYRWRAGREIPPHVYLTFERLEEIDRLQKALRLGDRYRPAARPEEPAWSADRKSAAAGG